MNVNLSEIELQIILQSMQQLNYSGQHVRQVGLLMDKLFKLEKKIADKKKVE